jgi:hypothetical protein
MVEASLPFGHEVGNGGDVITCGAEHGSVLDYHLYERSPGGQFIDLGPGDEFVKVRSVLNRLKSLDPERADRYLRRLQQIWPGEVSWISQFELMDLPDAGYVPTTACRLRQVVIQRQHRHPALKLLTIQSDIWQELDTKARAGLILHELIYEEMLGLGHNNSKSVRAYNAAISSSSFLNLTPAQYDDLQARYFHIPEPVAFKMDRFTYYVEAGYQQRIELSKLVATTETQLEWGTFGMIPEWIDLSEPGWLKIAPSPELSGVYSFDLSASSQFYSTVVPVQVLVLRENNLPPTWLVPGIAVSRELASGSLELASLATDLEQDHLRYEKISGPEWVEISAEGQMTYLIPAGPTEAEIAWISVRDENFRSILEVRF